MSPPVDAGAGGAQPRSITWALAGIVLLALLVRLPGVGWGANFPAGWYGHHPDEYTHLVNAEMLIDPSAPPRWKPHPYPKGLAALVAAPVLATRILRGKLSEPPPSAQALIVSGRLISVGFGAASVVVVALLALRLFADRRVALAGAGFLALGGLHVAQSHFFVSDVPSLFCLLLGQYLLLLDLGERRTDRHEAFRWAAFSLGVAFGLKLVIVALPTLAVVTLLRAPRFPRLVHGLIFFGAGFVGINLASFSPDDLYQAIQTGVGDPYVFSRWRSALLYGVELPRAMSLPLLLFGLAGAAALVRRLARAADPGRRDVLLVVVLPLAIHLLTVLVVVDHFPRHLVALIPWLSLTAGWALIRLVDALRPRLHPAWILAPCFAWLALFVYDGERAFLSEPRNEAYRWLQAHAEPGSAIWWNRHGGVEPYQHVFFPDRGRPPVLVIEMLDANHYLSGIDWRDSYPSDYRRVFDSGSPERLAANQALFRGETEYREVARFSEGYFMPEYRWVDRLSGNRSWNYVSEIVIFQRDGDETDPDGD